MTDPYPVFHTWEAIDLTYTFVDGDKQNVVTSIDYCVTTTKNEKFAQKTGTVAIAVPGDTWVDFNDIHKNLATEWVKTTLGATKVTEIETALSAEVELILNPTTGTGVPWDITENGN